MRRGSRAVPRERKHPWALCSPEALVPLPDRIEAWLAELRSARLDTERTAWVDALLRVFDPLLDVIWQLISQAPGKKSNIPLVHPSTEQHFPIKNPLQSPSQVLHWT